MVSLAEIARGVAKRFAGSKFRMYVDGPEQNDKKDNGEKAVVYITVEPVTDGAAGGGKMADREVLVDLAMICGETLSQTEYYAFLTECDRRLRPTLAFSGRNIILQEITARRVDEVGHYTFQLGFFDDLGLPEPDRGTMDKVVITKEV